MKDSGARESFDSGMVRDTEEGKLDFSLILDGPMFKRWAAHLTKGAQKYTPRNWMKASSPAELERFKRSFLRHAVAYLDGDRAEDHAAAMIFNINGMEYVRDQITESAAPTEFDRAVEEYEAALGGIDVLNEDHLAPEVRTGPTSGCVSCDCRSAHCHTAIETCVRGQDGEDWAVKWPQ